MLALRLPAAQKKVKVEMDKAKLDIEKKMLPKGPAVTRHLALPAEGKSPEWILQEMVKMDEEMGNPSWRLGKLSGAVYRKNFHV
jgi:sphinganine-1-phosphate aldolase